MNNRICRAAREQPPVVKFGLVHEDVRVCPRRRDEIGVTDDFSNSRPGEPLGVEEGNPPMREVVR